MKICRPNRKQLKKYYANVKNTLIIYRDKMKPVDEISQKIMKIQSNNNKISNKTYLFFPLKEYSWHVIYLPLNIEIYSFTRKDLAENYIKEYISDMWFSYCIPLDENDFIVINI